MHNRIRESVCTHIFDNLLVHHTPDQPASPPIRNYLARSVSGVRLGDQILWNFLQTEKYFAEILPRLARRHSFDEIAGAALFVIGDCASGVAEALLF